MPNLSSATYPVQADMALFASAGSLYQLNSTGGSTVWGVGTGGGGAADGVNIISMAGSTSGGGTTGTLYSQSTGTIGIYAGSNITLRQSNNAIVIIGPSPAAASLAIQAGAVTSNNTGITFVDATSANVAFSYDHTNISALAWIAVSGSNTSLDRLTRLGFSNSNGVSFGISTNTSFGGTITASIPQYSLSFSDNSIATFSMSTAGSSTTVYMQSIVGGGGTGGVGVSAGTQSVNTGTVVFSNSNSISFGMSGSSRMTASLFGHSLAFVTTAGNVTFSTSTATNATGATTSVWGSAAGGGGGTGGIAASMGAGTSASGTTTGTRALISTGTLGLFAGSGIILSQSDTNIFVIAPGPQIGAGSQTMSTYGSLNFINSNNVTFGMSGSSQITASLAAFSLAFSNLNGVTFGTSTNGSTTTVTASHAIRVSAGASSSNVSAITFGNGGNITFGYDGTVITASGSGGGGGIGTVAFSAAGGSSAYTTLSFRDLNGFGWTNSGGQVGFSSLGHTGYLTGNTQNQSSLTYPHNSLIIAGSGAISVGGTNGSLVISAPNTIAQTNQTLGIYGSSQTTGASSSFTHDARSLSVVGQGAVSVGWTNSSFIISAPNTIAQTNQSLGIYGSSQTTGASSSSTYDARSLTIVGQGIASVGWTNGSFIVSATQSNQGMSAGGVAQNFQTIGFQDSNGFSWSVNGSSVYMNSLKLSMFAVSNTTQSSSGTALNTAMSFGGAGAVSVGVTGGSVVVSARNRTADYFDNAIMGNVTSPVATRGLTDLSASVVQVGPLIPHLQLFPVDITANTFFLDMSVSDVTTQMSKAFSSALHIGIYTSTGATLSLLNSVSTSWGFAASTNNSTAFAGERFLSIDSTKWSSQPVFLHGSRYFIGYLWTSAGVTASAGNLFGMYMYSTASAGRFGTMGTSITGTATSQGQGRMYGLYSTTTASLPGSIANSELNKQTASVAFVPHVVMMSNTAASSY